MESDGRSGWFSDLDEQEPGGVLLEVTGGPKLAGLKAGSAEEGDNSALNCI